MSRSGKVVVAMSGGVDSAVAAALLKEQGYECVGVFMRVGAEEVAAGGSPAEERETGVPRRLRHGCCSVADALDARAVAGRLGIPFYVLNFQPDFERIIDYFVDEYARARTPNPCVICNTQLKFGKLLRYADLLDAEFVATGHYARILRGARVPLLCEQCTADTAVAPGCVYLARSLNRAKDQSYVLFGIRRADLGRCLFPLGEMADKAEVRRLAADLSLRVHDKPDSQEICFVPAGDYKPLVRAWRPQTQRPGEVRDGQGRVLGAHEGVANYTIGQRRGLGIATGQPIYVTKLDVLSNTVTIGPREDLLSPGLVAEQMNWLTDPPATGELHRATIKIRHMHTPAAGVIGVLASGAVEVRFDQPQAAVTPGQAAVFYDNEIVLGGGWIERAV
jgi:tRNA-specific 2-thiouridylase